MNSWVIILIHLLKNFFSKKGFAVHDELKKLRFFVYIYILFFFCSCLIAAVLHFH